MRIDAHHHFWKYDPTEYDWISEGMAIIRRDFLPVDLEAELQGSEIDGVVSVQARQKLEETAWLLELADATAFIKGVIGWVPLVSPGVVDDLARFASHRKLRGVRHVLQDEPDEQYMLRDDFNVGIRALKPFGLVYDILVFEHHLPQTIDLVDAHPEQLFVLDHVAKPVIRDGLMEPWSRQIRALAKRENVFCKLSGLVTQETWSGWTEAQLRPYAETVLEAFGPARTMFGSDWPVCLVACGYRRWVRTVERFVASLSTHEQALVFGATAIRAYGLT